VAPAAATLYGRVVTAQRSGTWFGVVAYTLWGIFPLYFTLLEPTTPSEILANRIIWSLVVCLAVLLLVRGLPRLLRLTRRQAVLLALAGVVLSINWLTFVYAVTTNQVVEASLGYFINPLVTVALGIVVLRERLNSWQIAALAIATVAVVILTANYGRIPWIALTLTLSFASYGLLKKKAGVRAHPATDRTGRHHRDPAVLLWRGRGKDSAHIARSVAIHHASTAVLDRSGAVVRIHARRALDRLWTGVDCSGDLHRGHDSTITHTVTSQFYPHVRR